MTREDREAFARLAEQVGQIAKSLDALEHLGERDVARALQDLVQIAPTLRELADSAPALKELANGYKVAGTAGVFVKWAAGIATAVVALWALLRQLFHGGAG